MAWGYGPSVVHDEERHSDVWRTWFLDECESSRLFGLTSGHLRLVTKAGEGIEPYRPGTTIYLEDAPWPATKDELIDYSIRSGAPLEVVENLQELEDDGQPYESIEEIWPDYPTKEDFFFNEDEY